MGSKGKGRQKDVKQVQTPKIEKNTVQGGNPSMFYDQYPSWIFHNSDPECWQFDKAHVGECFWTELFPYLRNLETRQWKEIFLDAKKQNHSIPVEKLNKVAQKRLEEMYVEAEAIMSLRVTGTHRIYGYMVGAAFSVLWFDSEHGDNATCVCRVPKKHT